MRFTTEAQRHREDRPMFLSPKRQRGETHSLAGASGSGCLGGALLFQETALQHFAGAIEAWLPADLGGAELQAVADLLQGVPRHVWALVAGAGNAGDRMIAMLRELAFELPHHVRLGGDEEVGRLRVGGDVP